MQWEEARRRPNGGDVRVDKGCVAPISSASRQGHTRLLFNYQLYSSPPPPPVPSLQMLTATFRGTPPPQMQRRGRSRHISPVALARQASEERKRSIIDSSPPADPDPQSLEDQIQVAYALDNIRLAKILLLKLKGVHVSDDTDPRIDQVRDEDFDMCFAPSGPLTLDDADKRALQETQRKQRQWWHESQRAQRLRACEKLWEDEKNRLHADRLRALERREHDAQQERTRLNVRPTRVRSLSPSSAPSHRVSLVPVGDPPLHQTRPGSLPVYLHAPVQTIHLNPTQAPQQGLGPFTSTPESLRLFQRGHQCHERPSLPSGRL